MQALSSQRLVSGAAAPHAVPRSTLFAPPKLQQRSLNRRATVATASAAGEVPSVETVVAGELPAALDRQLPSADSRYKGLKVLVAGATGGVGRAVVAQLVAQGVPVRALVRDGIKAASMLPPASQGVEVVERDVFKYSSVARAVEGCNAIICATGPTDRLNPLGPWQIDCEGNRNLVAAAVKEGVQKFVLVTSIGTDDPFFPLNLFWGVLLFKKQGELALERSGLDYTIVRPGGLLNAPRDGRGEGAVVMAGPDTFGLPPRKQPGSILRSQVADVCIEALVEPSAKNKIVEIITAPSALARPLAELFASV